MGKPHHFFPTKQARRWAPLLACALACAPFTGAADPVGDGGSPMALEASATCALPDFQSTLLQQVNAVRAAARTCGNAVMPASAPLVWNDRVFSAAARHAHDMAAINDISHKGRDGRTADKRISAEGYAWSRVGENVAGGQSSVTAAMKGWLASPGHCANIMRADFQHVGVSCVHRGGTTYGHHWTMKLATPQ